MTVTDNTDLDDEAIRAKYRVEREKRYHNPLGGKPRRNNISPALAPRGAGT